MFTTYKVIDKFKDTSKLRVAVNGREHFIDANRNNIAIAQFQNDDNPDDVHTYFMNADTLSDAEIDAQARNIIISLNAQEAGLAAITLDEVKVPAPVDPKLVTKVEKEQKFAKVSLGAMVRFRGDPAEQQAYDEMVAAQAAATSNADSGDAVAKP